MNKANNLVVCQKTKILFFDFHHFQILISGLFEERLLEIAPSSFVMLNGDEHCMTTAPFEVDEFYLAKVH